ncbi:MAG: hypothetical protein ABFD16_00390 [Thermoguttaceae bacterium]|jgi:flagellar basal body-associated protein FliL
MAEYDDVKSGTIALVGLIVAILTFAVVILVMVVYYQASARERYQKQTSQAPAELATVTANQQARLAEYRWVDQSKGIVTIPIDRAMELVVADQSAKRDAKPKHSAPPNKGGRP